jgi:MinD-like ATPase involved in chromosome partitioning or flagellar assembly
MTDDRNGQVVTFYSFKGGTGRTMALANTAWILASNGLRVLVVDWDLESPGLHRFFRPFISESMLASTGGVIDLIREYEDDARRVARQDPQAPGRLAHASYADVGQHAFSIERPWPGDGTLDFLSAGRHNHHYSRSISGLNWDDFYEVLAGGKFFDAMRDGMKRQYDFTLIDSRTGLSDVADICTVQFPDTLVACFTLSEQGIEGAADVARAISGKTKPRRIRTLPVPMRIDAAEKGKADIGLVVAKQRFAGLPIRESESAREAYWSAMQVPYQAFYAYEELLATIEDKPGPSTLLAVFERLVGEITEGRIKTMPPMDEAERARLHASYARAAAVLETEVTLRYDITAAVWAEWISWLLQRSGVEVNDPGPGGTPQGTAAAARPLVIGMSADDTPQLPPDPPDRRTPAPLTVYLAGAHASASPASSMSIQVGGLDESAAAEAILRLIGAQPPTAGFLGGAPRFPGKSPAIFQAPPRNQLFTGRAADLERLREQLLAESEVVPIALHGLGGIGKTQLAAEYAYRYRNAYDVVWWIDSDATADVDNALYDLGQQLGLALPGNINEGAQMVKQALSRGEPFARWLLIFDNAEDPTRVERLLPAGSGDVLVTAQGTSWEERARLIPVDVFDREDSIAHLRQRLDNLSRPDADQIAELLGDLPIAIAAAAAWLVETGSPVAEYLQAIERGDLGALGSERDISRVEAAWRLSLDLLQRQRPAAYRLLELCSVMAPEISLELIYSDAMADLLKRLDPAVSARLMLSRLVQQIKRLALLRVDTHGEQVKQGRDPADRVQGGHIVIHRLLQSVVRSRIPADKLEDTKHEVHLLLTAAGRPSGDVDEQSQWPRYRILWPHVDASDAATCTSAPVRQLLVDRVRYFYLRGNPDRGLEIADQVEQAWTDMLPTLEEEAQRQELLLQLLQLRFNKANILRDTGAFDRSLALDEEILARQQELLERNHAHTLMTAGSLAADYRGLGRYEDALQLDEATYEAWRQEFDDDHPGTLSARSNLAVSHRLMGNLREALRLDQEVYAARQVVLSPNHLSTLLTATSLGRDLREAGEYERSVALLTDVMNRYAQVLGSESRFVVNASANLAVSERSAGRPRKAAELLDAAYRQLTALVGADHPETLSCRLSRSVNLMEMGDNAAEGEIRAVHSAYEQRLGPRHPRTLVCVSNLAAALRAQRNFDEARRLARTAMDELSAALGPDHPYALAAQMNLAVATADDGDLEEALPLMTTAAEHLHTVLGDNHPHTLRCEANRAIILRRLRGPGYQDELDRAIERLAQRLGADHPAVASLRDGRLLRRIIDPHPF